MYRWIPGTYLLTHITFFDILDHGLQAIPSNKMFSCNSILFLSLIFFFMVLFCNLYGLWLGLQFKWNQYFHFGPWSFLQQNFFSKLVDLFRICEEFGRTDSLHMIFKLVKGIGQCWYLFKLFSLLLTVLPMVDISTLVVDWHLQFCLIGLRSLRNYLEMKSSWMLSALLSVSSFFCRLSFVVLPSLCI